MNVIIEIEYLRGEETVISDIISQYAGNIVDRGASRSTEDGAVFDYYIVEFVDQSLADATLAALE